MLIEFTWKFGEITTSDLILIFLIGILIGAILGFTIFEDEYRRR